MLDIEISYSDPKDLERLYSLDLKPYYITTHDSLSKKGKSDAWKLKSAWGAKLDPFIKVSENNLVLKCFYSETGLDVISQLRDWLNNKENFPKKIIL